MKKIGARIRQLLKEREMSQKELSRATGIPESTLSDIIKEKKDPGISRIGLIAEALEADLHWLVSGETYRESEAAAGQVAEPGGRRGYGGASRSPEELSERPDERLKYLGEIIAILKTLEEEERRLILEMAERLKKKR